MKAAVLGATGYTGLLLCRLLQEHPQIDDLLPVSSSRAGDDLRDVDPGIAAGAAKLWAGGRLLTLEEVKVQQPEVVFSALPHLKSAKLCAPFFETSVVVDLSADFRLRSPDAFLAAYGEPPPEPGRLASAVYGLCEWHRDRIRTADLIANPGCYPTGISGAGRKVRAEYLFCERSENAGAYSPGRSHRHVAEMEEQFQDAGGSGSILFVPHLAPLRKGMSVTTIVELRPGIEDRQVESVLREAYEGTAFVSLRGGSIPQTADVRGSNRCDIGWRREGRSLMLFSALDNLMKGASGQAVQNMNLRFGFAEAAGLPVNSEI
jgi:N-acetyl-gamma-glutamyl-phosphate reductase